MEPAGDGGAEAVVGATRRRALLVDTEAGFMVGTTEPASSGDADTVAGAGASIGRGALPNRSERAD